MANLRLPRHVTEELLAHRSPCIVELDLQDVKRLSVVPLADARGLLWLVSYFSGLLAHTIAPCRCTSPRRWMGGGAWRQSAKHRDRLACRAWLGKTARTITLSPTDVILRNLLGQADVHARRGGAICSPVRLLSLGTGCIDLPQSGQSYDLASQGTLRAAPERANGARQLR